MNDWIKTREPESDRIITGFITDEMAGGQGYDVQGDKVLLSAFLLEKAHECEVPRIEWIMKNATIMYVHGLTQKGAVPLGKPFAYRLSDDGQKIEMKAFILPVGSEMIDSIWRDEIVPFGTDGGFSIGGQILRRDCHGGVCEIPKVDVVEVSWTPTPANKGAVMTGLNRAAKSDLSALASDYNSYGARPEVWSRQWKTGAPPAKWKIRCKKFAIQQGKGEDFSEKLCSWIWTERLGKSDDEDDATVEDMMKWSKEYDDMMKQAGIGAALAGAAAQGAMSAASKKPEGEDTHSSGQVKIGDSCETRKCSLKDAMCKDCGEKIKRCVQHVRGQGHDESSAWAICHESMGKAMDTPQAAVTDDKPEKRPPEILEKPEVLEGKSSACDGKAELQTGGKPNKAKESNEGMKPDYTEDIEKSYGHFKRNNPGTERPTAEMAVKNCFHCYTFVESLVSKGTARKDAMAKLDMLIATIWKDEDTMRGKKEDDKAPPAPELPVKPEEKKEEKDELQPLVPEPEKAKEDETEKKDGAEMLTEKTGLQIVELLEKIAGAKQRQPIKEGDEKAKEYHDGSGIPEGKPSRSPAPSTTKTIGEFTDEEIKDELAKRVQAQKTKTVSVQPRTVNKTDTSPSGIDESPAEKGFARLEKSKGYAKIANQITGRRFRKEE
jgi:hypothetical protein